MTSGFCVFIILVTVLAFIMVWFNINNWTTGRSTREWYHPRPVMPPSKKPIDNEKKDY